MTVGKILVIDDDQAIRGAIRRILERDGHQVSEAENGERGLALFRAEGPELVVTDLIMPEKEGIETILELRALSPDVKILAMSGSDPVGRLGDAEALGANASLAKPFSVDGLRAAVADLLGR